LSRSEITVEPGDKLVLTTDGVSDNLHVNELVQIIREAASPEEASKQVKNLVNQHLEQGLAPELLGARYRHDDQTAIIRFFNPD
jgi:serine/threonine protein phosphatase PrpC